MGSRRCCRGSGLRQRTGPAIVASSGGAGEGAGLGLSISWDIVTQHHGGTITESESGAFTEFTIRLPRH
jgi:signal transduction histidine kinase